MVAHGDGVALALTATSCGHPRRQRRLTGAAGHPSSRDSTINSFGDSIADPIRVDQVLRQNMDLYPLRTGTAWIVRTWGA